MIFSAAYAAENNKIFISRYESLYTYNSDNTLTKISKATGTYSADVPQLMTYNDVTGYYFLSENDSDDSPRTSCYYSSNLSSWTKLFAYQYIRAMFCYDKYLFVAIGLNYGSADTIIERHDTTKLNTEVVRSPIFYDDAISFIGYFNGYIVGYQGGDKQRICYCDATSDLSNWKYVSMSSYMNSTYGIQSMRILNGRIVLCNYNRIIVSSNITSWSLITGLPNNTFDITYYEGKYYIAGSNGKIVTSTDLVTWTTLTETSGHAMDKVRIVPISS